MNISYFTKTYRDDDHFAYFQNKGELLGWTHTTFVNIFGKYFTFGDGLSRKVSLFQFITDTEHEICLSSVILSNR